MLELGRHLIVCNLVIVLGEVSLNKMISVWKRNILADASKVHWGFGQNSSSRVTANWQEPDWRAVEGRCWSRWHLDLLRD